MKKNAVIIASILFVAGCATDQGNYQRAEIDRGQMIPVSDPSIAAQYDPATGGYPSSVSGFGSSYNSHVSGGNYHADSSIRGGSNEARGFSSGDLATEPRGYPMNPAVQADSSIRGGSPMARQREWNGPLEPSSSMSNERIKADSSRRGGSNEARYSDRYFHSSAIENRDRDVPANPNWSMGDENQPFQFLDDQDRADFGQSTDQSRKLDKLDDSLLGSANWNPSDDLLPDGPADTEADAGKHFEFNNDASVGGAARSETGSASSSSSLNRLDVPARSDLNSSLELEKDISGQYGTIAKPGNSQLAERVKATLTRESTGVNGLTSRDVARNIQVTSHGGTVTLKGTVPTQKDKEMIEIRAREMSDVNRVDNQLTVSPQANPNIRNLGVGHDLEDITDQLHSLDRLQD